MIKLKAAIIGMGVVGKRRKYFIEKNNNYKIIAVSDITFKKDVKKITFVIIKIIKIS